MLEIKIDTIDRTSIIEFGSIAKKDIINQQVDSLSFIIIYHPGQTFRPDNNSVVVMKDGATTVFAGRISAVTKSNLANGSVEYKVQCKDYSIELDRLLVNEQYVNTSVEDVIADILTNYAPTFTDVNVNCAINVEKISFARVTVTDAIQRLAEMSSYSWYVDYLKDIHFFEKNTEPAPFNLADNDGNYITESLELSEDFSQLRNRVFIKGGEIEGTARSELFNGDAAKKQFKLSNKFAHLPTVTVGGGVKTVGLDYIDDELSFDCFWDYNQQYIRFKDTTIPGAGTNNIVVTGIPLYNLVVQVEDPVSQLQYGVYEFAKEDKTILSRDVAVAMARTELLAYKDGLIEGSFQTYTAGLRSGQVITINSTLMGVNETFLIQNVSYKQITKTDGIWSVELATLRTTNIIDFLIGLLKSGSKLISEAGEIVLEKTVFPLETITTADVIDVEMTENIQDEESDIHEDLTVQALNYDVEFVLGPQIPSGTKRVFILDGSPLA
jgi:hypothetical protein